jgi:hypothetical protein
MPLLCPRAKSSAIAEARGVNVRLERVNVLKPSDLHRHCLGTAFTKATIGAVVHHGRQSSDRITPHL